jgi:colanic acid/amylovoran biosynthesis glycosyltransferase
MIDQSFFEAFDREVNPNRTPMAIISVGRFHWQKGYAYALRAVHQLKQNNIDFRYTVVAGEEIPEEILFLVHQLDLAEHVTFIDKVPHHRIPQEMKRYSILLLPSLVEGIANVVLEAMAVGLPVISTRCGGMEEVVFDQETGWLVPIANPTAIADAIVDFSKTSDEKLKTIRVNAFNRVRQDYQKEIQVQKMLTLYHASITE